MPLSAAGIQCKVKNPIVDANFQDQQFPFAPGVGASAGSRYLRYFHQLPSVMKEAVELYEMANGGPLNCIPGTQICAQFAEEICSLALILAPSLLGSVWVLFDFLHATGVAELR